MKENRQRYPQLTFWAYYQTSSFLRTAIYRLKDINQLLLILQHPVEFVVVSGSKIAHHMFIAEEEHYCHRVIEFVHLNEIWHLIDIAKVDDGKILDAIGDSVEHFILPHAYIDLRIKLELIFALGSHVV